MMGKTGWKVIKPRKSTFKCQDCHREFPVNKSGGTGYAVYSGKKVCYECAAARELKAIGKVVPGGKYDFYLSKKDGRWLVQNWTGKIVFPVSTVSVGDHNMAGKRIFVRFTDHLGRAWYGTNVGDNSILRARRAKS